jgi:hypothetical protein
LIIVRKLTKNFSCKINYNPIKRIIEKWKEKKKWSQMHNNISSLFKLFHLRINENLKVMAPYHHPPTQNQNRIVTIVGGAICLTVVSLWNSVCDRFVHPFRVHRLIIRVLPSFSLVMVVLFVFSLIWVLWFYVVLFGIRDCLFGIHVLRFSNCCLDLLWFTCFKVLRLPSTSWCRVIFLSIYDFRLFFIE